MKAAKTIDELYDEVKGYDIVISNDAALVTALNNRIDTARIGRLASTPRMIAKDHEDAVLERLMNDGKCVNDGIYGIMDDVGLLETISDGTGYDIRFVHGEVENIRTIRRYTKEVEKHLIGKPSKEIYRMFEELPTYEMVMGAFDPSDHNIYEGKNAAVIGVELFDDLDKHFIPLRFDEIDIFRNGDGYDIDVIYAVGNDRQVAEHAVDLVTEENAEDVAIVMDTKGPVANAVRSALYRKRISFKNSLYAKDIVHLRDLMEFVRKGMSYEILTVGDVRELFASYGGWTDDRYDEYLLSRHTTAADDFTELSGIMKNIREYTFGELCGKITDKKNKGTVTTVLGSLNLLDEKINERTAGAASYLINSMDGIRHNAEIPENEKKGVLLADCCNSVFIDRPFVIYLNLDTSWSRSAEGRNYIDPDEENEKESQRFQALLQQGSVRIYLVNTMKNGKPARPCTVFDRINKNADGSAVRIDSFGDIVNTEVVKGMWRPSEPASGREKHIVPPGKELKRFSKTSMNEYVMCPRRYMFSELVRTPDSESTVFGNMIHAFAEFCVCYPEIAEKNMSTCIEMISERCAGISCPEKTHLDRSRVEMSVNNVKRFIDSLNIRPELGLSTEGKERKNIFFEVFGMNITSDAVETDRVSENWPLHGEFDLLIGDRIIDYKTGRPNDLSDIMKKMDIAGKSEYSELQPYVYLAILDDLIPGGRKEFTLFYTMDNEAEAAADPDFDVLCNTRTVELMNMNKNEIVSSGMLLEMATDTKGRAFLRHRTKEISEAFLKAGVGRAEQWPEDDGLFDSVLGVQEKKNRTVMNEIRGMIKAASKIISGCLIRYGGRILIPRDSMTAFREYAKKIHARANEQQNSVFPCRPRNDCRGCGFFNICTEGMTDDGSE